VRVLHVDAGREYRGGQNQVRLLVRELAREPAVEQRLVTRRDSELARRTAAEGVAVREVPWTLGLDPRAWWRLVAEARAWRPDVIHAHNSHAVTLAVWARGWLRRAGAAPRVVATRRVVFRVSPRSALHRVDAVVAISEAVRSIPPRCAGRPPSRSTSARGSACPTERRSPPTSPRSSPRRINAHACGPRGPRGRFAPTSTG